MALSDSGKALDWRRRVRRFGHSGMTVVRFCREEGVSTASFYRWRNRLAERGRLARNTDTRSSATTGVEQTPLFQPVRVTGAETPISIQLPGGVRIQVPAENLDAVRAVLGELLRHDAALDRGDSQC
jgi:transposase-like protein